MSTDPRVAADPDSRNLVDIEDPDSLRRWSQALGVTDEALRTAVEAVGTRVDQIKNYLGAGGTAGDQADA